METEYLIDKHTNNSTLRIYITLEDDSMFAEIKDVLKMIKGIASVNVAKVAANETEADPFAELDTNWGGDRDANEIAEELHSQRGNLHKNVTW